MKAKTKLLTGIVAVGLLSALITGGTMAWFTSQTSVKPATFTAGTVEIKDATVEPIQAGILKDNVNPGDEFTATWTFVNTGTKAVKIRVKPEVSYDREGLSLENVKEVRLSEGWTLEGDLETGYLVYSPVIAGTKDDDVGDETIHAADEAGRTVTLTITGRFGGPETTNEYQGATLKAKGILQAVQASNGAPFEAA